MYMEIIEFKNVTKKYKEKLVIDNVSFKMLPGFCYLVIGANGSGKSTLIKLLTKVNIPNKGIITTPNIIGYVPEKVNLPDATTIKSFLYNLCLVRGYDKKEAIQKIDYELKKWNVKENINTKMSKLSKGTFQKIIIIQAYLTKSKVYVFDEPLNGLDVKSRKKFFELIDMVKKDNIVIISTHYRRSYIKYSDKVLIIEGGKIISKN